MGITMATPLPHYGSAPARVPGIALWLAQARRWPKLPAVLLGVLCLASFGARAAWIGLPCQSPCIAPVDHLLIFDEHYYVNSARVIAGIRPPAAQGAAYSHAPLGSDPNAEHPQLAKLIMAGTIELLGDGPWGWRLGSLLFGTLSILGMFALVRAARGGPWLALGAAALMASDNLMLVQGRIGTLEVYVVAAMVWAVALYLWDHPVLAGIVTGVGACMKPFGLDVVPVLLLYELFALRVRAPRPAVSADRGHLAGFRAGAPGPRGAVARLTQAYALAAVTFIGLLAILDEIAPPYDNAYARFVRGGPFAHIGHMISYAAGQVGQAGIASYPWLWLIDLKPIVYFNIDVGPRIPGAIYDYPSVHFLGFISPPILLAGLIGTAITLWKGLTGRVNADWRLIALASAWFLGTFVPFLVAAGGFNRTSYLYYMTIVMPGMYVAAAWLVRRLRRYVWLVSIWVVGVIAALVLLYPFTPLT
jgi:hypothetical protein